VSTDTSSGSSTSASGLTNSLTEAQTYTREARRAEETAARLESQASWMSGNSATGSLNLSQAYREWGLGELEANRDFYGNARFDDIDFQLSAKGQEMQTRFVQGYADRLHDQIENSLTLPEFAPVARPSATGPDSIRSSAGVSSISAPPVASRDNTAAKSIATEVGNARANGKRRLGAVQGSLSAATRDARGASAEAADAVKEW
jgi:conjugal transfer mating pair stabilization protein TraG